MIKLSNSSLLKIFTKLLVLVVVAKSISLGLWWYLPSDGEELIVKANYQPKYQRVDFKNMIQAPKVVQEVVKVEENAGISITNMVLKGLYGTSSKGFIIVAMKTNVKDTSIVGVGEEYKGFTLKSITLTSAIFVKDSKDYVLELDPDKKNDEIINKSITKVNNKKATRVDVEPPRAVTRKDIDFFAKNPKQIWREISISEVRVGNKIKGFKVTRIDPKSKFATLGLQKNDLIVEANNVRLESYRDALEIYKNIGKLETVQIVVIRDNQEKELVYEIN